MKQMRKSARDETDKMKKEVDLRRQSDACRKERCLICDEEDVCDPEMIAIDDERMLAEVKHSKRHGIQDA